MSLSLQQLDVTALRSKRAVPDQLLISIPDLSSLFHMTVQDNLLLNYTVSTSWWNCQGKSHPFVAHCSQPTLYRLFEGVLLHISSTTGRQPRDALPSVTASQPPSTLIACPVTLADSSDARNTAIMAMSSGGVAASDGDDLLPRLMISASGPRVVGPGSVARRWNISGTGDARADRVDVDVVRPQQLCRHRGQGDHPPYWRRKRHWRFRDSPCRRWRRY